jgi:hypothetical protein
MVVKFTRQLPLPRRLQGECLQNWGEAVVQVCSSLPDAQLSPAREQEASAQAAQLFQLAVQAYKQVSHSSRRAALTVQGAPHLSQDFSGRAVPVSALDFGIGATC